jgi:hypothetical protein
MTDELPEKGNLYEPPKRLNTGEAIQLLGMNEVEQMILRLSVTADLLCAHAGITEEQIQMAYEQRLKTELTSISDSLKELAGDK